MATPLDGTFWKLPILAEYDTSPAPQHLVPPGFQPYQIRAAMGRIYELINDNSTLHVATLQDLGQLTKTNTRITTPRPNRNKQEYFNAPIGFGTDQCGFEAAAHLLGWVNSGRTFADGTSQAPPGLATALKTYLTDDNPNNKWANWHQVYGNLPAAVLRPADGGQPDADAAWQALASLCPLASFQYCYLTTCSSCKIYSASPAKRSSAFALEDFMLDVPSGAASRNALEGFLEKFFGVHAGTTECPSCDRPCNVQVMLLSRLPLNIMCLITGLGDLTVDGVFDMASGVSTTYWDENGQLAKLELSRLMGALVTGALHTQAVAVGTTASPRVYMWDWYRSQGELFGHDENGLVKGGASWDNLQTFQRQAMKEQGSATRRIAGVLVKRAVPG